MTHQKWSLALVGLTLGLFTALAAHAATIEKQSLICRHLETLDQYRRAPDGPRTPKWTRTASCFQSIAVLIGLASIVFFIVGMIDVRNSIVHVFAADTASSA